MIECYQCKRTIPGDEPYASVTYSLEREHSGAITVDEAEALSVACMDCAKPRDQILAGLVAARIPTARRPDTSSLAVAGGQFEAAAALATTVLTINATAERPGTIDPHNVGAYQAALVEAREGSGLQREDGLPLVENLLHMLWRLADFAAGRPAESTTHLVAAFATSVAAEEA